MDLFEVLVNRESSNSADLEHRRFFASKKKAGVIFVNLTASYDTVWHCGLNYKLPGFLSDKHMVRMIIELVRNQCFTFATGDSKLLVTGYAV